MTKQEIKWAQADVFKAGNILCQVGLRVDGSKYEKKYREMYNALNELNRMLIEDLKNSK